MKGNQFKKETTGLCHFCDYTWKCKKGHKCNYYKKWIKKYAGGRMPKPHKED